MRTRFSVLFFWGIAALSFAQDLEFCEELKAIKTLVEDNHFSAKPIDDTLSQEVWKLFIKNLDDRQRYFRSTDIEGFKSDEFELDEYINSGQCAFITSYIEVLQQRINDTKEFINSIEDENLDYSGKDSIYYRAKNDIRYFTSANEAKRYWRKKIRFEILSKLIETDNSLEHLTSNFKALEQALKPKVIANEICLLNELEQRKGDLKSFVEQAFFNAYLNYQDPNSAYLSRSDKELFEQSIANSQSSFGISTEKKTNGDIVVAYIAPGSSAYKHGGIEVNDIILSLQNKHEMLETFCISNERITGFINDSQQDQLTFKLKKQNGKIATVTLRKTKLDIEANSITGFVLKGKLNIGYISIPSFYTDLESITGLGVANDVAKQIYKLQREGIEGLILNLRFNGGGSMKEAAELTGLFIDRGPVAISQLVNNETYTLRDPNRGQVLTQPVVVLVNQFSASASELFAAALQDYNRALMVGSPTHGKATSQRILPLSSEEFSNFIKLTTGQFFRVTGNSHQKIGVIPDISLPSIYEGYRTQELHLPHAIENSSVDISIKHRPQAPLEIESINEASQRRKETLDTFTAVRSLGDLLDSHYINRTGGYPLTLGFLYEDIDRYNRAWQDFDQVMKENPTVFAVENTSSTNRILSYNDNDRSINKQQREELARDPYVQEAYLTLIQLLSQ